MRSDDVKLSFRCEERWQDMVGDARERACARCRRTVVDLSHGTEDEARAVLAGAQGANGHGPCVRFDATRDGAVLFRNHARSAAAGVLASLAALSAPASATTLEEARDVAPSPGQVHVCSSEREDEVVEATMGVVLVMDFAEDAADVADAAPVAEPATVEPPKRRRTLLPRWRRLYHDTGRPTGGSLAHVAADPDLYNRAVLACDGFPRVRRARLDEGEAVFETLPTASTCEVRLRGPGRPTSVEFTAGNATSEVEVPAVRRRFRRR